MTGPSEQTLSPKSHFDTSFDISATEATSRPRQTLKSGNAFAVVDSHGDIGVVAGGVDGIFHCDTRYLSRLEVLIDGAQPLLLGSNMRDFFIFLTVFIKISEDFVVF